MHNSKIIFTLCLHPVSPRFLTSSLFIGCFPFMVEMHHPFDNRYFYEAFIIFVSVLAAAVLRKSQEAFSLSDTFIHCWYKYLLPSQCSFFLVIISLLLYYKAIPILLIPVVLFLFSFSASFNGILVGYFSFSSDFRLLQSSPLYNFQESCLLFNSC